MNVIRPKPVSIQYAMRLPTLCKIIGLLLALEALWSVHGKYVAAQPVEPDSIKYWIFFTDKPAPPTAAAKAAERSITDAARERRSRRGIGAAPQLDWPVHPDYVQQLDASGVQVVHESRWLNAVSAYLTPDHAETVSHMPFVARIKPVGLGRVAGAPSQSDGLPAPVVLRSFDYGSSFTQLERINAIGTIESGIIGNGVRLGLIDTGLGPLTHAAFDRMQSMDLFIESKNFTGLADDGSRHALYVLSIAAGFFEGEIIGPAYGAHILHARTEYTKSETRQEEDNFVAGLEWMESQGVDVVNVSLSYTEFDGGVDSYTYADMNGETAISTLAADTAVDLGVVVVVSAGNDGANPWHFIGAPADGKSVITVGATTSTDTKAVFSSYGPTADGRTKPDISAMGSGMTFACPSVSSPDKMCISGDGTSFSAPLVSGVVAQMLQVNPDLTTEEVLSIIRLTARIPVVTAKADPEFPNNSLGWGIIDAGAAVAMAVSYDHEPTLPESFPVSDPYPNPTSGSVRFSFSDGTPGGSAELEIFDLLGRRVSMQSLATTPSQPIVSFLPQLPASGLFVYRLTVNGNVKSGKLVVVR